MKYMRSILPVLAFIAALSLEVRADYNSAIGTTFWFVYDNQSTWPFVDFFKQCRPFWSTSGGQWEDGNTLNLDTNGYPISLAPGQAAVTLLFWDGDARYPAGDYTLLYDGQGTVVVDYSQGATITVKSNQPGRQVVNVPAGIRGLRIMITATTPANPVRNIHFIAPGFEENYQTQIFHPLFLERLHWTRCIRYMDWMCANSAVYRTWAERPRPTSQTFNDAGGKGVCVEYLVELANRANFDPWFCMPTMADDDFFRRFVTYVRDNLKPCLKAHFEYNNEMWNGGIKTAWGGRGSTLSFVDSIGRTLGYGGWEATAHGTAKRTVDLMKIVEEVYAGQMNRCVRVIGGQLGNSGVVELQLTATDGHEPAANHGDVIAVNPYFNPGGAGGSVDDILNRVAASVAEVTSYVAGDAALARRYNMRLVAYESGLDVFPATFGLSVEQAVAVRFHPRMYDIQKDFLDRWKAGGGTHVQQYSFCNPIWGTLQYMDQDTTDAPIYRAISDWSRANPQWWDEPARASCASAVVPLKVRDAGLVHTPPWSHLAYMVNGRSCPLLSPETGRAMAAGITIVPKAGVTHVLLRTGR